MASMAAIRAADNAAMKANTPTYNTSTGHIDTPSTAKVVSSSTKPTTVQYVETPAAAVSNSIDYQSILNQAQSISNQNSAMAQAMAEKQWAFNAEEAQKNRDWQEYMSNTAHQREMADLLAAGLNPILTANSGAAVTGGATASGSSASPDTSMNSVLGSFLTSLISSATAINTANINARTNLAIGQLNHDAAITSAGIGASASRYASDNSYMASILKNINNIDVAKISRETGLDTSGINAFTKIIQAMLNFGM